MARYYTEREFYQILIGLKNKYRTQKEFADALGFSPQYISDVMQHRRSVKPVAEKLDYQVVFVKKKKE